MFDIVFLSYNEINADENWERFVKRFPWAKRVHGIDGIHNAHRVAAETILTRNFYVVDADNIPNANFDFSYVPPVDELDFVRVWRCINAVNDLVYGYGGIKLFPRKLVLEFNEDIIDFTTTVAKKFKVMNEVASTTKFNTSPFDSWKSGFRECVKLSSKIIENQNDTETNNRLDIWCSVGMDKLYGTECIAGANAGREYGTRNKDNKEALAMINDFSWLENKFNEH